jgi:hypothetical protein
MVETMRSPSEKASLNEEMLSRIAEKVRDDSQSLTKLTSSGIIRQISSELELDALAFNLDGMQKDEKYQDVQCVVASTGEPFLYSNKYITDSQAESLAIGEVQSQNEEIKVRLAETVRHTSKDTAKLTGIDSFCTAEPPVDTDRVRSVFADMEKEAKYKDIRSLEASSGGLFLFSESYISNSYAKILLRAEENDPCATIASTVRDESKTYPRPTRVAFFKAQVFNISPDELDAQVLKTLERPEFNDIKLIDASTGARYLYSNLYLTENHARSLVEWEEVGKLQNP